MTAPWSAPAVRTPSFSFDTILPSLAKRGGMLLRDEEGEETGCARPKRRASEGQEPVLVEIGER